MVYCYMSIDVIYYSMCGKLHAFSSVIDISTRIEGNNSSSIEGISRAKKSKWKLNETDHEFYVYQFFKIKKKIYQKFVPV